MGNLGQHFVFSKAQQIKLITNCSAKSTCCSLDYKKFIQWMFSFCFDSQDNGRGMEDITGDFNIMH